MRGWRVWRALEAIWRLLRLSEVAVRKDWRLLEASGAPETIKLQPALQWRRNFCRIARVEVETFFV